MGFRICVLLAAWLMQPFEAAVCEQLLAEAQRFLSGAPPASVAVVPRSVGSAAGGGQLPAAARLRWAALAPVYQEATRSWGFAAAAAALAR